jgi:hypothetical protein
MRPAQRRRPSDRISVSISNFFIRRLSIASRSVKNPPKK